MKPNRKCPTCGHTMAAPRLVEDRRLTVDKEKAQFAIASLEKFIASKWQAHRMHYEVGKAKQDHELLVAAAKEELARMRSALADHGLLWRIFRRKEKRDTSYRSVPTTSVLKEAA